MHCSMKMKITPLQFFTCMEDQLLLDLKLNAKRLVKREKLVSGFSYEKSVGKRCFTVTLLEYERLHCLKIKEENDREISCSHYKVEALASGGLQLELETQLFSKIPGVGEAKKNEVVYSNDSKNLARGQSSLLYRLQLKSLERQIRKRYASLGEGPTQGSNPNSTSEEKKEGDCQKHDLIP